VVLLHPHGSFSVDEGAAEDDRERRRRGSSGKGGRGDMARGGVVETGCEGAIRDDTRGAAEDG
jgi:hypothetical protein